MERDRSEWEIIIWQNIGFVKHRKWWKLRFALLRVVNVSFSEERSCFSVKGLRVKFFSLVVVIEERISDLDYEEGVLSNQNGKSCILKDRDARRLWSCPIFVKICKQRKYAFVFDCHLHDSNIPYLGSVGAWTQNLRGDNGIYNISSTRMNKELVKVCVRRSHVV